jgi:hypothetical protein
MSETTADVSIRQIVNMTESSPGATDAFIALDTCGRMWFGILEWHGGEPDVRYNRVPVPQVPADPPPADTVAQLRAELTLSEYRYEALLKERDKLKDELDACNEFLSRES